MGLTGQTPVVADGKVYVGDWMGRMYCFDHETGEQIWNYSTGTDSIYSFPAVVNARVYTGSNNNNFYCLDAASGALLWNYTTGGWVASSAAVIDGRVYTG